MTDPQAVSPPTTTTAPRFGRGLCWSDMVRDIELDELERQARQAEVTPTADPVTSPAENECPDEVRPEIVAALTAAMEEQLTGIVTTSPPPRTAPITLDEIFETVNRLAAPPPEPIKLTQEQIDSLPTAKPNPYGSGVIGDPFGVPVELVDTYEESTPAELVRDHLHAIDEALRPTPLSRRGWLPRAIERIFR